VVILAAGASTRLGQPKQLLRLGGVSLVARAAATAVSAALGAPVVVVLGDRPERLTPELTGVPVTIALNREWSEGMASSLRAGIAALQQADPSIAAAIVMLCDQPLVTADTLHALRDAYDRLPDALAAGSEYGDGHGGVTLGPPCLFSRALFPDLLKLRGAHGAKPVLARLPPARVARVPFPGGDVDIDTPEDWERAQAAI
jgi:molybdenum cofactor cytidylyltransferase